MELMKDRRLYQMCSILPLACLQGWNTVKLPERCCQLSFTPGYMSSLSVRAKDICRLLATYLLEFV